MPTWLIYTNRYSLRCVHHQRIAFRQPMAKKKKAPSRQRARGRISVDGGTTGHADPCTVMHCLYGYKNLGISTTILGEIYRKDPKTIRNWKDRYEKTGTYERRSAISEKKFTTAHREWLLDFYESNPLAYLDEAQATFQLENTISISKTSVWNIIHEYGLTWKVLERRAMHIKECDCCVSWRSSVKWIGVIGTLSSSTKLPSTIVG